MKDSICGRILQTSSVTDMPVTAPCSVTMAMAAARAPTVATATRTAYGRLTQWMETRPTGEDFVYTRQVLPRQVCVMKLVVMVSVLIPTP